MPDPLDQVTPVVVSDSVTQLPIQAYIVPVIGPGGAFTVMVFVVGVPQPLEYVIVVLPAWTPVTIPVILSTNATESFALDQFPPVDTSDRVIVAPTHTTPGPDIGAGMLFTVATIVAVPHPFV